MTEDVAISLSDSISSAFEADSRHEIGGEEKSKDGRRSSRLVKSLSVPQVPGKVAIQIIANILSGPDPSCISARKALLTSPTAYGSIERALVRATFQAEKMLDINQVSVTRNYYFSAKTAACFSKFFEHSENTLLTIISCFSF
jgi:hypothetical protein